MVLIGAFAALGTSLCWSLTSTFFTLAGRLVGSVVVNRVRLVLAVVMLIITHQLLLGRPLPWDASPERVLWLALSGILGLVLGDAFLFQAFVWIGPRLSMLLMSLVPVISTLLAWIFLNETLTGAQLLGVFITVGGIAWVVLDVQGANGGAGDNRRYLAGVLFGLGGATGQALGLVTAKKGLAGDFSAVSGTLIRMISAVLVLWAVTIATGKMRSTWQSLQAQPRAFLFTLGGAFFGPFLGVTLSLVAVQAVAVGVASTLMSLPPVFLLPIGHYLLHERIGWRTIFGTVITLTGVAILLLI